MGTQFANANLDKVFYHHLLVLVAQLETPMSRPVFQRLGVQH